MHDKKDPKSEENGYLFSLDILIRGKTNGQALEKLTHLFNGSGDIIDYRIMKGINLGQVIEDAVKLSEQNKKEASLHKPAPTGTGSHAKKEKHAESKQAEVKQEEVKQAESRQVETKQGDTKTKASEKSLIGQINQYVEHRTLVRLSIVKGKGVKLSIPCRILNLDEPSQNITVYHVDEKKVYSFRLTEIDELTPS